MSYLFLGTENTAFTANPGSPDWWLKKLVGTLLDRQIDYGIRGAYVEGNHPVPNGDPRYRKVLQDFQYKARTNYSGMITSAPIERMRIRGFRFGPPDQADSDAQKIWTANNMELLATRIHARAAKFGLAYALVEPPPQGEQWPVITIPDPRSCIVFNDPRRPDKSLCGLELWIDEIDHTVKALLYLPQVVYAYQGPDAMKITDLDDISGIKHVLFSYLDGFRPAGSVPNPLGDEIPLVEYVWRPDSGDFPEGEIDEGLRDIQDRINHTILDRLVISKNQAYRQRFVTGYPVPKGAKGRRRPPFDPGSDMLWVAPSTDAKFGEFATADIRQILEAVRDDIADMAAISKTPPHYLMGKVTNVSGETLTQATDGLVQKTKQRMVSMGFGHERVMKKCFKYLGQADKATDVEASVLWEDPNTYTVAELADAGLKWGQSGIPLQLIMERQGWSPDQIVFAVAEFQKRQEQELLLATNRGIRAQDTAQGDAAAGQVLNGPGPKGATPAPTTPTTKTPGGSSK